MAFFVLGIPAAMWVLLYINKKKGLLEDVKFTSRYGVLFETYKPKFWWWDVYAILRRVVLIGMGVWFNTENLRSRRFSVISFINLIFFGWHVWNLPFKYKEDNILEGASLALLLIFTIFLGQTTSDFTTTEQAIYGTAFLGGTFLLICWMVYLRWALRHKLGPQDEWEDTGPDMGLSRRATLSEMVKPGSGSKLTGEHDGTSTSPRRNHEEQPLPPVVPQDLQDAAANHNNNNMATNNPLYSQQALAPPIPIGLAPMAPPLLDPQNPEQV
jgi:hypothetical protein